MEEWHRVAIPTPFDVGRVNCYVFPGEPVTLLDPGPATGAAYEELSAGLEAVGLTIDDVDRVLITHPHMDHFGLAARIVRTAGACTVAHRDATGRLTDPQAHLEREQAFFEPFLQAMGVPESLARTAVTLPDAYAEYREPVSVDRQVTGGDTIETGAGSSLTALHTPGHAPGSICLVEEAAGVAFTGDHVLEHISPNPLLTVRPDADTERTRSLPTYLDSLCRLRRSGADVGYGGHGDRIENLAARIDAIVDHHARRRERIADIVHATPPVTAYDVMGEMFPDLPATEVFPGMSEVIGHLDLLEDDDRVEIRETEGVRTYAVTDR